MLLNKNKLQKFKPLNSALFYVVLYIVIVLTIFFFTQNLIKSSQKQEVRAQVERISSDYENRIFLINEYLNVLSQSKSINAYFKNKALGMSLKYGLKIDILKLDKEIDNTIKTKVFGFDRIFDFIVLQDNKKNFISKEYQIANEVQNLVDQNSKHSYIFPVIIDNKLQIFIVKQIFVNNTYVGNLIAKVNISNVLKQIIYEKYYEKNLYIKHNNNYYNILDLTHNELTIDDKIELNIAYINLTLVLDYEDKFNILTSPIMLIIFLLLSTAIALVILKYLKMNNKNELLKTKIKMQFENNKILERKVASKTKELEELNLHLQDRVNKEVKQNISNQRIIYNQSKMAIMGQMLDNIAHQWRQPLSAISSTASGLLLQNNLNMIDKENLDSSMTHIMDHTKFLSETIEDFRSFLKENKEKENFNLKETYEKTRKLLISVTKNSGVKVIENIQENVELNGFSNELVQVLMNILNNAYEAFSDIQKDERYIFVNIWDDEKFAYITIKDSAGGVPDKIRDKIFESRFTTKIQSNGTGIGLYMTKEIVISHMNGDIDVVNEEYEYEGKKFKGANFFIKLPK